MALDLSSNELAQFAHVGWGYILVTFPILKWHVPLHISLPILITIAGIKEYWDCHGLENTATSGGAYGSWEDFCFWCLGFLLGVFAVK